MKKKHIQWEEPVKKRSIDTKLPYDKEIITKTATIGQDARGIFLVRFPKEISEDAQILQGDLIEYTVEKPIPIKDKNEIKISFKLIRRG